MNQHSSNKRQFQERLRYARELLRAGYVSAAQDCLRNFWKALRRVPASTRRRWRCGR